jgi:curved DNA-binding protein CbpA
MEKNYYEVLEIPTNASDTEIQKAYIRAKNAYGQESLALYSLVSEDECSKQLSKIEEAHHVLSDPSRRVKYDQSKGIRSADLIQREFNKVEKGYDLVDESDTDNDSKSDKISRPLQTATTRTNISKIVATKRFNLDYEIDPLFEEEIAQATEFSGELLRKIREYKKVDPNRMADMTKVSKTYIINIENENLVNLPALVYVRGFIYQYAKCLKLNPELVATSYIERIKQKQKSEAKS